MKYFTQINTRNHATIIRTANHYQLIPAVALELDLMKSIYVCDEGTIKMMTNEIDIAYEMFNKEEAFDVIVELNNQLVKLLDVRIQTIRFIDSNSGITEVRAICNKWMYVPKSYLENLKLKEKVKVMLV
jgi:hypothetical protein